MEIKKFDRWLIIGLRWLIAIIFIYAGIGKIIDPATFTENIDNYRILPYLLVTIMAIILPWLEVLCGLFLIISKMQKGAMLTLLGLTFMFLIAISSAIARGLDITCGCFVADDEFTKIGYTRLIEDIILFAIIFFIYIKSERTLKQ